jgi:hypothetical protein
MQADVRMLSGSKRSCEGYSSLQDEAEADDASMVSTWLWQLQSQLLYMLHWDAVAPTKSLTMLLEPAPYWSYSKL